MQHRQDGLPCGNSVSPLNTVASNEDQDSRGSRAKSLRRGCRRSGLKIRTPAGSRHRCWGERSRQPEGDGDPCSSSTAHLTSKAVTGFWLTVRVFRSFHARASQRLTKAFFDPAGDFLTLPDGAALTTVYKFEEVARRPNLAGGM